MGGKKKPETNRKYEKDRRDRFNDQFTELHKLLPEFNSSVMKVTKAEIIGKAIEYLRDSQMKNQKLEREFENEKTKISQLQKKVSGLLQIVKELIKLLHKSNVGFPSSLPVDDFKSFKDEYIKRKRKSKEAVSDDKNKTKRKISECSNSLSDVESVEEKDDHTSKSQITNNSPGESQNVRPLTPTQTVSSTTSVSVSVQQTLCTTQVMNLELPKVLRIDSNSLILPNGNVVAVNGLQNAVLNNANNSQTLLLNKQVTVPTFILMQNNFVPVSTVQHIPVSQRSQKVIAPKQTANTTKTIFINKKPIPAVRLYKSAITEKDGPRRTPVPKRKRNRRSKGILVKYPKRKAPNKGKKREIRIKKLVKQSKSSSSNTVEGGETTTEKNSFSGLQSCENVGENPYSTNAQDMNKTYSCSDNIFDTPDIQTTRQFIDFFENNPTRCIDNNTENNVGSTEFVRSSVASNSEKNEKQEVDNFNESSFERPFANTNINCNLIESSVQKEQLKETETQRCVTEGEKNLDYLPNSSTNDSLLLKYVSNNVSNECLAVPTVETSEVRNENTVLDKRKSIEKEIAPLTIHCNLSENKSSPKDLNLPLIDDKKHYESSFDDLFTSLQVPASGQNTDSISPTAAFLHSFPLVSSCKNVDLLPEHEEDSNTTATTSMTILQIGNLESPSTMLFTSNKTTSREGMAKNTEKLDEPGFAMYCNPNVELENTRKEKNKDSCKEITTRSDGFNFSDVINFKSQPKNTYSKEPVSQNMSFYPACTSSAFPSYNIFTKYNDISAVPCSYYSLSSQPFSATKSADPITDFNSWMPYTQEDLTKDKNKRDKCTLGSYKNTMRLSSNDLGSDRTKNKKSSTKQNNTRPLVNWMTSPDLRNAPDTSLQMDVFSLQKEDSINGNTFLSSPTIQNNSNFNVPYSSSEYFLENQNYADTQLNNCKITYSSSNPSNYSWSPSKSTLPALPMDTHNMIIPSTLPTLVGDLALGNNSSFNNYDLAAKKYEPEKKKETCKNYFKNTPQNSGSFLSVTQLVDDKAVEKSVSKKNMLETNCRFDDARDKCYKENYNLVNKGTENTEFCKKAYSSGCKDTKNQNVKCKKDIVKYNHNVTRCISKENKKDTRHLHQKPFNEYSSQNCRMLSKDVNPLSNKNINYSAESLISSSNHQNPCSTQSYFPYENTTNYGNCGSTEYTKKRTEETEPLTNVGYYANTNYVYHNNFQSLNNYGFSNQCYNNYSSQIQQTTSGFQKKKDENYHAKQDSSDWYKDNFPTYNSIVPAEFATNNQKLEMKCKQSYSNKYNQNQKNAINSETFNKYYQCGSSSSLTSATTLAHTKSSCSFNTAYSFSQTSGQHCSEVNCLTPNYDMKTGNRNLSTMNSSNIHPATTFSNFNLSTIFPEINDKHCVQNRVNTIGSEKNNSDYTNKVNLEEMNYNYLMQPVAENNPEPSSVYATSSFQIQHFTDFSPRKIHK